MIDRRRLGLLKDGARVIIISRGGIVDEQALADELMSGRLGGAGIDAFSEEPLSDDSPFWDLPNVIVSPHSSAHTPDMTEGRRRIFVENLRRYVAKDPFLYVVDKKAGF
jgi:phosphoglycerate dehydrogenase-like enzyme